MCTSNKLKQIVRDASYQTQHSSCRLDPQTMCFHGPTYDQALNTMCLHDPTSTSRPTKPRAFTVQHTVNALEISRSPPTKIEN